jgi:hypothetical protein
MQLRTKRFTEMALQTRDTILAEFLDVLEHPNRTKYITLLNTLTPETISIFDFKVPSWRSNERLLEVNNLFKRLKVAIKEIQKRDYLSITPKVEDIKVVYKWVSVRPSTYFLIKKVFLALGQKNETSLHRKSATEICRGLREIFFISKGLLSVKKHIYLPLLSLEEALRARSVSC